MGGVLDEKRKSAKEQFGTIGKQAEVKLHLVPTRLHLLLKAPQSLGGATVCGVREPDARERLFLVREKAQELLNQLQLLLWNVNGLHS